MKPITYWVQTDVIDIVVDDYGAHLQKLPADDRRTLIALLSFPSLWKMLDVSEAVADILWRTEDLNRREKDLLIEAIAATLTHQGNPWVENARANVAISQAQKKAPLYNRDDL